MKISTLLVAICAIVSASFAEPGDNCANIDDAQAMTFHSSTVERDEATRQVCISVTGLVEREINGGSIIASTFIGATAVSTDVGICEAYSCPIQPGVQTFQKCVKIPSDSLDKSFRLKIEGIINGHTFFCAKGQIRM
ncbi:hypothetical protein BGZ94_004608 [Podila epigama]|nr:hypothetical protein BGZ94_004608 [Podila epigama]